MKHSWLALLLLASILESSALDDQLVVTVNTDPANGGIVQGGGKYPEGSIVSLTALPADNWEFVGWSSNIVEIHGSTSRTVTFVLRYYTEATALFRPIQYVSLLVTSNVSSVEIPHPTRVKSGEEITLVAPREVVSGEVKYVFSAWVGDAEGKKQTIRVLMDRNKTLKVLYTKMSIFNQQWFPESEYVALQPVPITLEDGVRLDVRGWVIPELNLTVKENTKIPQRYAKNIQPVTVRQFLLTVNLNIEESVRAELNGREIIIPTRLWLDDGSVNLLTLPQEASKYRFERVGTRTENKYLFVMDAPIAIEVRYKLDPLSQFLPKWFRDPIYRIAELFLSGPVVGIGVGGVSLAASILVVDSVTGLAILALHRPRRKRRTEYLEVRKPVELRGHRLMMSKEERARKLDRYLEGLHGTSVPERHRLITVPKFSTPAIAEVSVPGPEGKTVTDESPVKAGNESEREVEEEIQRITTGQIHEKTVLTTSMLELLSERMERPDKLLRLAKSGKVSADFAEPPVVRRTSELKQISGHLYKWENLVVTGPPGTGKTIIVSRALSELRLRHLYANASENLDVFAARLMKQPGAQAISEVLTKLAKKKVEYIVVEDAQLLRDELFRLLNLCFPLEIKVCMLSTKKIEAEGAISMHLRQYDEQDLEWIAVAHAMGRGVTMGADTLGELVRIGREGKVKKMVRVIELMEKASREAIRQALERAEEEEARQTFEKLCPACREIYVQCESTTLYEHSLKKLFRLAHERHGLQFSPQHYEECLDKLEELGLRIEVSLTEQEIVELLEKIEKGEKVEGSFSLLSYHIGPLVQRFEFPSGLRKAIIAGVIVPRLDEAVRMPRGETVVQLAERLDRKDLVIVGPKGSGRRTILRDALNHKSIHYLEGSADHGEGLAPLLKRILPVDLQARGRYDGEQEIERLMEAISRMERKGVSHLAIYDLDMLEESDIQRLTTYPVTPSENSELRLHICATSCREQIGLEPFRIEPPTQQFLRWYSFTSALRKGIVLSEDAETKLADYANERQFFSTINTLTGMLESGTVTDLDSAIKKHEENIRRIFLDRAPRHRRVALELLEATGLLGVPITESEINQCYEQACRELGVEPNEMDRARLIVDLRQFGYNHVRPVKPEDKHMATFSNES